MVDQDHAFTACLRVGAQIDEVTRVRDLIAACAPTGWAGSAATHALDACDRRVAELDSVLTTLRGIESRFAGVAVRASMQGAPATGAPAWVG